MNASLRERSRETNVAQSNISSRVSKRMRRLHCRLTLDVGLTSFHQYNRYCVDVAGGPLASVRRSATLPPPLFADACHCCFGYLLIQICFVCYSYSPLDSPAIVNIVTCAVGKMFNNSYKVLHFVRVRYCIILPQAFDGNLQATRGKCCSGEIGRAHV